MSDTVTFIELTAFVLKGCFVVLSVLLIICACCYLMSFIVLRLQKNTSDVKPDKNSANTLKDNESTGAHEDEVNDELIAVITAAVSTVLDQNHRVINVRRASENTKSWAKEGRAQLHASHKIR